MRRKKLASVVFLAVVAAFIVGCGGEQASDSSADEQDAAQQETESTEESAASIGEPVTIGDVRWTVTKGEWSDILVSERWGNDEGYYVLLDVNLSNNSNQDLRLATPFLTLVDNEGREFEPDIEMNFFHLWGDENMFVGKVEPGATKKGRVIFPIAPDSSRFKLRVGEARFASNETRDIDLGALPKAY